MTGKIAKAYAGRIYGRTTFVINQFFAFVSCCFFFKNDYAFRPFITFQQWLFVHSGDGLELRKLPSRGPEVDRLYVLIML